MTLDALLSSWRAANPGSIVHVGQGGIRLHRLDADTLQFADATEALEYLTRP